MARAPVRLIRPCAPSARRRSSRFRERPAVSGRGVRIPFSPIKTYRATPLQAFLPRRIAPQTAAAGRRLSRRAQCGLPRRQSSAAEEAAAAAAVGPARDCGCRRIDSEAPVPPPTLHDSNPPASYFLFALPHSPPPLSLFPLSLSPLSSLLSPLFRSLSSSPSPSLPLSPLTFSSLSPLSLSLSSLTYSLYSRVAAVSVGGGLCWC